MKSPRFSRHLPLASSIAALLSAAFPLHATDLTWDIAPGTVGVGDGVITGGSGSWNIGNGNWTSDGGVTNSMWTNGNNAIFGGTGGTINVDSFISVQNMSFNADGYTIGDSDFNGMLTLTGTSSISVLNSDHSATISETLAGSAGLSKTGLGTLTFSGANTYTGVTNVSAGILKAGSSLALGSSAAGSGTTVSAGATLDVNGQGLNGEVVTISGAGVENAGAIVNTGASQTQALRFVTLVGNSSVGGTARWDIRSSIGAPATFNMGGFTLIKTGSNDFHLASVGVTNPGNIDVAQGSFWIEGSTLLGGSATNTLTIRNGAKLAQYQNDKAHLWSLNFEDNTTWEIKEGPSQWKGAIMLNGATNLLITNAELATGGVISGAGSLIKSGTGGLGLTDGNSYSGGTTVNAGTLYLGGTVNSAVGTIRGTVTINTGAILQLNKANALGYGAGTKVDTININGGILYNVANGDNGWGVTYNLTGGAMLSGFGPQRFSFGGGTSVNSLSSATTSEIRGRIDLREGNPNNTVVFDVANGAAVTDLLVSGVITQSAPGVGITKNNAGTMLLTGTGFYTSATTINGGCLVLGVKGSLAYSPITVNNGGGFYSEVTGKTVASLTANNGATLGFVAQMGATTNIAGALTLSDGAGVNISLQGIESGAQIGNVYDLATAGSIAGSGTTYLSPETPFGPTRVAGTTAVVGNKLQLTLTSTAANLTWNNASASGAAAGTWDANATANFDNAATNDVFKAFDYVTFNDTVQNGSAKTINLTGRLAPLLITVNNSAGDYIFASTGALVGNGSLVKSGASKLTLGNTGGYGLTGNITVNGGALDIGTNDFTLGPGSSITVNGGLLLVGNGGTTGSLQTFPVTYPPGGTPVSIGSGGTVIFNRSDSLSIANVFTGSGTMVFDGTNDGINNEKSTYSFFGGSSGFTGSIIATNSRVRLFSPNDVGSATLSTGTNSQFYISAGTYANNFTIAGNGWGEYAGQLGAIRLDGGTLSGAITLAGNARITTHSGGGPGTGIISGPITGAFGVTFGGSSNPTNLTLTGASNYTGTTTIGTDASKTATINLAGSLGATAVTVNAGSTIGGKGSIGSGGSLTFANSSNLAFDGRTAGPLNVNGNVTLGATTTVNLTPGAALTPGAPVTLLTYGGSLTGTTANIALANAANYRQVVFTAGSGAITLNVGAKSLTWTGTGSLFWGIGGTATNWKDTTPAASTFFNGDTVRFDDTAGVGNATIALTGNLAPSTIVVNNATVPYTFSSSFNNWIVGGASLLKDGAETLKLDGSNQFNGGTIISEGTIESLSGSSFGTGSVTLGDVNTGNAGTSVYLDTNRQDILNQFIISSNGAGPATLGSRATVTGTGFYNRFGSIVLQRDMIFDSNANDGTDYNNISGTGNIRITGTGRTTWPTANTFTGDVTVATTGSGSFQPSTNSIPDASDITVEAGARLNFGGSSETFNALHGSGTVSTNTQTNGAWMITMGANNGSGEFSGVLVNHSGTEILAVTKAGTGTQILSGHSNYTGATTVNGGTLLVSGGLDGTASVVVNSGGKLQFGVDHPLYDGAKITLGGGTLATAGFSDIVGMLTLSLSSTIDLGNGASVLKFADSSASVWGSGALLTITNWSGSSTGGGADQVYFGFDDAGLGVNISAIQFLNPAGFAPGAYGAQILPTGEIVAVPEPNALTALFGGAAVLLGWRRCRK
jgi:autotransporter-associated beta strand protein